MTSETIEIGSLRANLTFKDGLLEAVDLPEEPPADLDSTTLREMNARLQQYPRAAEKAGGFAQRVRERMCAIPAGSAMTYAELATAVESSRAMRAVGQVCATNRLLLVVPCHRVVAESGLGGFRLGLAWKRKLLELEAGGC
jgi:O-6-methylguanine DNA methyltransferase